MPTYNDPAFGQAVNNIAKMFAPPDAQTLYLTGKGAREQAEVDARRKAIASIDPTISPYASIAPEQFVSNLGKIMLATRAAQEGMTPQGLVNAQLGAGESYDNTVAGRSAIEAGLTGRNNADNAAAASRLAVSEAGLDRRSAAQRQADIAKVLIAPISQDAYRPDVSSVARQYGLPADAAGPAFGIQERDPKKDYALPGGQVIQARAGDQEKLLNVLIAGPNGQTRTAVTRDFQTDVTGAPLLNPGERAAQIFNTQVQGGAGDVLGPTKANLTEANRRVAELNKTLGLLDRYDQIISNPGTIGLVGDIRRTAQNLIQTGNEVGQLLGSEGGQIMQEIQAAAARGAQTVGAEKFDPNLDAAEFMRNLLAYRLAQSEDPRGEVGLKEFERANQTLGQGWLANQASARARINEFRQSLMGEKRAYNTLTGQMGAPTDAAIAGSQPPPPAAPASPAAAPAARKRWVIGPDGQLREERP